MPVAGLGKSPEGPAPLLFWVEKEEITEGSRQGKQNKTAPSPLAPRSGFATACFNHIFAFFSHQKHPKIPGKCMNLTMDIASAITFFQTTALPLDALVTSRL